MCASRMRSGSVVDDAMRDPLDEDERQGYYCQGNLNPFRSELLRSRRLHAPLGCGPVPE